MSETKQRSKNTPEECAVIVKAWAEGKTIQYFNCNDEWKDRDGPKMSPLFHSDVYRVKPEPRTFEFWISQGGSIVGNVDSTEDYSKAGWTKIKAKEIVG